METSRNAAIKDYINSLFIREDVDLLNAKKCNAILPNIAIPENVGKLLYLLTKLQNPKRILEIGTLGGYSTIWFAKAAPEAHIITLEVNPDHASIALDNFKSCNLLERIQLLEGDARATLQHFVETEEPPFDLIFLDADKENYPLYLPLMLKISRPGTLILTDNLIPKDEQINKSLPQDGISNGTYLYNSLLAAEKRLETILITTIVGSKGRLDALGASIVIE